MLLHLAHYNTQAMPKIHTMNFHYVTVLTLRFLWILQGFSKMCGSNSYYEFPLCHCSDIKVFVDTSRFFENVWTRTTVYTCNSSIQKTCENNMQSLMVCAD